MKTPSEKIVVDTLIGQVDLEGYEKDGQKLLTHKSLLNFFNKTPFLRYESMTASEMKEKDGTSYPIVTVAIKNVNNGELILGLGSAKWETVAGSAISEGYQLEIARNRAMDDALLQLMGITKEYYSDAQMSSTPIPPKQVPPKQVPPKAEKPSKRRQKPAPTPPGVPQALSFKDAEAELASRRYGPEGVTEIVIDPSTFEPIDPAELSDKPDDVTFGADLGAYVIKSSGSCNGMTIKDAYEKFGDGILTGIEKASKAKDASDSIKEDARMIKAFFCK